MNKKLNKFRLKRLVLLVFALTGFVLQAEASRTAWARLNSGASSGVGTIYIDREAQNSCTKSRTATVIGGHIDITFTLSATPAPGYQFVKWSDGTTSASHSDVTISSTSQDQNDPTIKTITAEFKKIVDTYYLDLALGNVEIGASTFSGFVHDQRNNSTYHYSNVPYTSSDKFYIYQSTSNNVGSTGWNGSSFTVPSYSGVTTQNGGTVAITGYSANDAKTVADAWSQRATSTYVGRNATSNYISITGSCNVTVDNVWSDYQQFSGYSTISGGVGGGRTTGGISVNPGTGTNVNITLKGDSRFGNIFYHSPSEESNNHLTFKGGTDGKGSMVVASINTDEGKADDLGNFPITVGPNFYNSVIGGSDNDNIQAVYGLKFDNVNVFAGCGLYDNCTAIGGGGNGMGVVEIVNSKINAVARTTGTAIGGGIGHSSAGGAANVTISGAQTEVFAFNYGPSNFDTDIPVTAIGGGGSNYQACEDSRVTIKDGAFVYAYTVGGTAIGGGNSKERNGGSSVISILGTSGSQTKVYAKSIDRTTGGVNAGVGIGGGFSKEAYGGTCDLTIEGNVYIATGTIGGGGANDVSKVGYAVVNINQQANNSGSEIHGQFQLRKSGSNQCTLKAKNATISSRITDPYQPANAFVYLQEDGRAIWIGDTDGLVTLENVNINGCTSRNGGAVWMSGGTFTYSGNGSISKNTATGNGGAVYITNGTVTISGGTIGNENADYGNTAAVGGGIYAGGGTITVKEAGKVLGNTATGNGGGIYAGAGNITIKGDGTKISYNSAADGGGLFANSGSITIDEKAELSHNTANNGAGLYAAGGDLTVQGQGNLNHNIAENNGGGVYSVKGLTFHNATMDSNEAKANGGGVYVEDDLVLTSATIKNNKATDNGGGVYLSEGQVILNDMTVKSNQATNGAGLYINNGSIVMTGGSITGNIASQDGGGSFSNGNLTLEGGTELKGNQADNGNGGAFYVANGTTTVKQGNTIDGNFAKNGAGAYVSGTLNLTRSSIINNIASDNGNGGGVYSNDGTTTLTEMTVSGNRAGTGGGFYVSDGGSIAMIGGSIATNKAINGDGGGIYTKGDFTFQSGAIDHNEARQNGGGVYAAGGTLSILAGNVTNNTAAKGGGIYAKSDMTMSDGSIANNKADKGGGLYAEEGTSTLTDGDIQANAAYDGGGIYIYRNATLNLYKSVRVTGNTCGDVTSGLGGGIYQDGTLNVAGTEVKVSGNVKENPSNGVQTPNNVYLVGEYGNGSGTDDHFTCINIVNWTDTVTHITYHGLQENVDIGINVDAVPHAVIHSDSPDDPGHLTDLYIKLRDHAEDALLKDDLGKYQAIYADAPLPYNHNDIFFTGTWQAFAYPEGVTVFNDVDRAEDHDAYFGNISTEQRLAEFMCYVNGLNGYTRHPDQKGQVTRDLYMSDYIWLPIGSEDGNNPYPDGKPLPYSGHFDGGGHIINGLTSIGLLGMTTYGLFGHTAEATISNTFVTECLYRSNVTETLDTYDTIGGIVGKMVGGKLYYSEAGGTLFSNGNHSIMGGLVGYAENAEIHSCMAMPAMECGEGGIMGGLVGKMYANGYDLNHGFCRVMNCFANPMFTTTATTAIGGGLVGVMNTYLQYNRCEVTESYVRLDRKHSFPETFATDKGIAALVGDMSHTDSRASMTNVYLPEPGHCGVPGYSYVLPHRITSTGAISNYATYRAVSDPGVYAYDPSQDTRIDVIQQGVIPCPDEPQLLPQLLKQAVDRNYAQAVSDRPVPPICYWKRTGASSFLASGENINGDYPILDFDSVSPICGRDYAPAYIALGSKDGLTMDYCVSLSDMIRRYNDYEGGGAINLFHNADVSGPDDFKATDNDVRLYIDEGITVLQGEGGFLNAVSYQTLRYGHVDYWHTFSSVMGPRTTSLGTKGESRIGFNYGITGEVAYDYDNGNPCDVTLDHGSDTDPNSNYSLFPYDTKLDSLDLYSFYEPEYHWINFKRNSNSHWHMDGPWEKIEYENEEYLIPGKGYLVALHPQPVLDSHGDPVFDDQGHQVYNAKKIYEYGILNCGNVTSGTRPEDLVTYTIQASGRGYPGYNLLGNPYQAYLNLDAFAKENKGLWSGERDLDTTFYMYDAEQNAYLGYKYDTEPSKGSIMPSKWIAPHQGFFVVKSNAEGPTTARFIETGEGGMAHLTGDGGLLRGENDKPACRLVNLVMKDEAGHADVASIEFGRQKQGGLPKQQALRSGEAIIYTSYQDKDYAMLLLEEDVKSLPLHFDCTEGGTYTLSWNTANGRFPRLTLVDNLTGVSTDCLTSDSYTFEARPDDYKSRFKLVFHYDFDEEEESESHISNFAFINGGDLIVNGQGYMEIMDVSGHVLLRTRLTDNQSRVSIPEVAAGIYIIRLGEKSQKIVIR